MRITASIDWRAWGGAPLVAAHVQRRLPSVLAAPSLQEIPDLTRRETIRTEFLTDLRDGMRPESARRFGPLEDPNALAVVAGQQPGCVGGALLVLLKSATAVALARRLTRDLKRPVVPLFWNGTDDVDFDEISRVAWPGATGEMFYLELPATGRKPQGLVGELPAAGDLSVSRAAMELVGPEERRRLEPLLPSDSRDHGLWVGALLENLFPTLAVIDARQGALRRHAAPLFARYLSLEDEVPSKVRAAGDALAKQGFQRTLNRESARRGLFLLADGQRQKVDGDAAPLRSALTHAPETLSPNVLLRAMVQDSLFPIVANVVGPAEVGYLHELRDLRQELQVPESALVPRLSLTWFDEAGWETLERTAVQVEDFVADPEKTLRRVARERVQPVLQNLRPSFEALESQLETLNVATNATWKERGVRRLRGVFEEIEAEMTDAELQSAYREHPALPRLRRLVRPRERPQERLLAGIFLACRHGASTGERLVELAEAHLDALEHRELSHYLVVD